MRSQLSGPAVVKLGLTTGDTIHSITLLDGRFFDNIVFPCVLTKSDDEEWLREVYERLAYGGTAHV